jgi:hypothetical protein
MHQRVNISCARYQSENGWNLPIFLFGSYGTLLADR